MAEKRGLVAEKSALVAEKSGLVAEKRVERAERPLAGCGRAAMLEEQQEDQALWQSVLAAVKCSPNLDPQTLCCFCFYLMKRAPEHDAVVDEGETLEFEDEFEDDMSSISSGETDQEEQEDQEEKEDQQEQEEQEDQQEKEEQGKEGQQTDTLTYLPGTVLEPDHTLVADQTAYDMLHSLNVEWPCLSVDFLMPPQAAFAGFPATIYPVAGSQSATADNLIYIMKVANLHKTREYDDDQESDDDEDNLDEDPILEYNTIVHNGCVNRIRVMPHTQSLICATFSENTNIYIWDVADHVDCLDTPGKIPNQNLKPIHSISNDAEGYALDWSTLTPGKLLSGNVTSSIKITTLASSVGTTTERYTGHTSSVEDLQWSPVQNNVFASCSADQTIKIWDTRTRNGCQLSVHAHESDINCINWNRYVF